MAIDQDDANHLVCFTFPYLSYEVSNLEARPLVFFKIMVLQFLAS